MSLTPPLSRPTSLLEHSVRPTHLPAVVQRARPAMAVASPVLRADRGSRQLSLPFFFTPADRR
jgi:hypothetical protein